MSTIRKGLTLPQAEPAMVRAIVVALLLLASLGFSWAADVDPETITAWAVALGFLVPILQGLWTRYGSTANAKVVARVTTGGQVVAGDAAVIPTGTELAVRTTRAPMSDGTITQVDAVPIKPNLAHDTLPY